MSHAYHLHTLPSGLTVLLVPMPGVQSVTSLLLCKAGSRFETPAQWGIAHFLEHMVFKGTEKYPTAQELASAVDSVGATFNAFTSHEYTGYYVKSTSKHLGLALDVLSDMVQQPKLRQSDIDREKNVIIEEMNMYADNPARAVGQHFQQLCFLEQTLGHDIIGTKQTVSAMTTADFQRFLGEWYGQQNFVLVLAGDAGVVLRETLLKEIKQCFQKGDRTRGAAQPRKRLGAAPLTTHTLHVAEKKTEQAHFVLGFPAFSCFDDRRYALAVLANILGGNMSSRLFSEVREKRGLCYYVHSDVDLFYDTGIFGASAGVDPQRIEEAIRVTIAQFTQVIDGVQPITPQELSKAKENVAGRFALEFEESESVAQYYGMRYLVHGAVQTPEQTLEKYQAVTLEHVMTVAQELIQPKHLKLALIGPYSDTTPFEQLLSQ